MAQEETMAARLAKKRMADKASKLLSTDMDEEAQALREAGVMIEELPDSPATRPQRPSGASTAALRMAELEEAKRALKGEPEATPSAEKPVADLMTAISGIPGAPSKAQLEAWKSQYPEVLVLPLTDTEVYIYRYLTHFEWKNQLLKNAKLVEDEEAMKTAVVNRCILFPDLQEPGRLNSSRANLRDLLFEVIMRSSYFIDPDVAIRQVSRL